MIAGVFEFSFAQAKTRAMKGNLLDAEDWHYLMRMKSLEEVMRYLSGTAYSEVMVGSFGPSLGIGGVIHGFYESLFRDYSKLMRAVPARGERLLRSLIDRYEAENLKTILRGLWRVEVPLKTGSLLFHLGALSRLPVEELLQARHVTAAVDLLKGTIFQAPLLIALPQFKAQERLFPIEIAIDMAVFQKIAEAAKSIKSFSRIEVRTLMGKLIDWVNLNWVVRFRHFYGLSAEETINYTLRGGYQLGLSILGKLARAPDVPSFLAALPPYYSEALREADRWQAVPVLHQGWFIGQLYRAFQKNPFQIGLQVSYLLLKEMEVKSLESLICTLDLGELPEKVSGLFSLPFAGGARV